MLGNADGLCLVFVCVVLFVFICLFVVLLGFWSCLCLFVCLFSLKLRESSW